MVFGVYRPSHTSLVSRAPSLPSILEEPEIGDVVLSTPVALPPKNQLRIRLDKDPQITPRETFLRLYKIDIDASSTHRSPESITPIEISESQLKSHFINDTHQAEGRCFKDKDTLIGIDHHTNSRALPYLQLISNRKEWFTANELMPGTPTGEYIACNLHFTVSRPQSEKTLTRLWHRWNNRQADNETEALLNTPRPKNTTRELIGWYNLSTGDFFAFTQRAIDNKGVGAAVFGRHLASMHWEALSDREPIRQEIYQTQKTNSILRAHSSLTESTLRTRKSYTNHIRMNTLNHSPLAAHNLRNKEAVLNIFKQLSIEDDSDEENNLTQHSADEEVHSALATPFNIEPIAGPSHAPSASNLPTIFKPRIQLGAIHLNTSSSLKSQQTQLPIGTDSVLRKQIQQHLPLPTFHSSLGTNFSTLEKTLARPNESCFTSPSFTLSPNSAFTPTPTFDQNLDRYIESSIRSIKPNASSFAMNPSQATLPYSATPAAISSAYHYPAIGWKD